MTMTFPSRLTHDFENYARIVDAHIVDNSLRVAFADGSEATILLTSLQNDYIRDQNLDWSRLRANVHEITVPSSSGELVGIPWDSLRALSDPEFSDRFDEMGRTASYELGEGIRSLRIAQGLHTDELASRAGITRTRLEQIEDGKLPADLDVAEQILGAMCFSLDDLSR